MNRVMLFLILLLFASPAFAQTDHTSSLKHAARHGDPEAIIALVEHYRTTGNENEKQYFIEFGLLQLKAQADIGNADAARALADIYGKGSWIERDEEKRQLWLENASILGDYKAFLYLSKNADINENSTANHQEIINTLKGFAASGVASAWYELGKHYSGIHGEEPNMARAMHAYHEAAKRNNRNGMTALAQLMLINTDKSNDNEAIEWMQKAAAQGEAEAQYAMALIHLRGAHNQPRNNNRYRTLIRQAADGGIADAQYRVAIDMFAQDKKTAMRYVELAANQQHVPAKAQLKKWSRE